jgi:hypothetical protein
MVCTMVQPELIIINTEEEIMFWKKKMKRIYVVKWNNGFMSYYLNKKAFDKATDCKHYYEYAVENRITE